MRLRTFCSMRASLACGWSRRPSTRTTRPCTTSSTPTNAGRRVRTSRSSSTRTRRRAAQEPGWEARGDSRSGFYRYDAPPTDGGLQAAGTVHHVAWSSQPEEHEAWRAKVIEGGAHPTPVIDRFYFKSIYFSEPSGVLFEIATLGPGFTVDEPLEHLGEKLSLPPAFEHLREQVEPVLTPLPNPRERVVR